MSEHLDLDQLADALADGHEPAHVAGCPDCRARLDELGTATTAVSGALAALASPDLPAGLADRLASAIDQERRPAPTNVLPLQRQRAPGGAARGAGAAGPALVLGAGGSSKAAVAALRLHDLDVTVASRRDAGWPPPAAGYGIVVNTTPVRDDPLIRPDPKQRLVDLPYNADASPTAFARAGREAGAHVVDGREILLAQGIASFERWTGMPAPAAVMRAALAGNEP
jgi:hypothetical protein